MRHMNRFHPEVDATENIRVLLTSSESLDFLNRLKMEKSNQTSVTENLIRREESQISEAVERNLHDNMGNISNYVQPSPFDTTSNTP